MPTSWRSAFPGKYLQTTDLTVPIDATIAGTSLMMVGSGADAESKLVAVFTDTHIKALVLNLTRAQAIEMIAGTEDVEQWVGVRVRLSRGTTMFQGKRVACIVVGPVPTVRTVPRQTRSVAAVPMAVPAGFDPQDLGDLEPGSFDGPETQD